ncbi:uncharacterized protein BXZ73DRAFT_83915 [Epithele typhae]|uniref:uncharacterized protein n=1 Tax=Epithele typhae TaxID=378194 RepID=UPI00200735B5|nr:uncharacterized protein BXZ73DRAFT_83915 [Epithele typhae]KAH9910168.1 hypothetical protein BXZ73DRAFT_83915 [Epithele typhae]
MRTRGKHDTPRLARYTLRSRASQPTSLPVAASAPDPLPIVPGNASVSIPQDAGPQTATTLLEDDCFRLSGYVFRLRKAMDTLKSRTPLQEGSIASDINENLIELCQFLELKGVIKITSLPEKTDHRLPTSHARQSASVARQRGQSAPDSVETKDVAPTKRYTTQGTQTTGISSEEFLSAKVFILLGDSRKLLTKWGGSLSGRDIERVDAIAVGPSTLAIEPVKAKPVNDAPSKSTRGAIVVSDEIRVRINICLEKYQALVRILTCFLVVEEDKRTLAEFKARICQWTWDRISNITLRETHYECTVDALACSLFSGSLPPGASIRIGPQQKARFLAPPGTERISTDSLRREVNPTGMPETVLITVESKLNGNPLEQVEHYGDIFEDQGGMIGIGLRLGPGLDDKGVMAMP